MVGLQRSRALPMKHDRTCDHRPPCWPPSQQSNLIHMFCVWAVQLSVQVAAVSAEVRHAISYIVSTSCSAVVACTVGAQLDVRAPRNRRSRQQIAQSCAEIHRVCAEVTAWPTLLHPHWLRCQIAVHLMQRS